MAHKKQKIKASQTKDPSLETPGLYEIRVLLITWGTASSGPPKSFSSSFNV